MSSKTFVPYEGATPSKRQARRISKVKSQTEARQAKRLAGEVHTRAVSGLDRKAEALGITVDEQWMQLSRKERALQVHRKKKSSLKQAA